MIRAALLAALLALGGCGRGSALDFACDGAGGCPAGWECVRATGVCERSSTPLDGMEEQDLSTVQDGGAIADGGGDGGG